MREGWFQYIQSGRRALIRREAESYTQLYVLSSPLFQALPYGRASDTIFFAAFFGFSFITS